MKITCLMMQKNEHYLLEPWILYHGLHFGFANLYVYDNGSDDQASISILRKYEALGLNVNWKYCKKTDFENKGYLFSEKIKQLDGEEPSDFYFPMDCDEFMVVENTIGDVVVDTLSILNSLAVYKGCTAPLAICTAFDNNPMVSELFFRAAGQRKTFFSKNTCWTLDLGFHDGKTKTGEPPHKTNIAYVHYHYKSFQQYVESARQKLEGRVDSFSKESLEEFSSQKLAGFHLVGTLIGGRDKYYQNHYNRLKQKSASFYELHYFNEIISRLGLGVNDVNTNLPEAFDKNIPRWKGYIDTIKITNNGFELAGWIVSLYEFDLANIVLIVCGKKYKLSDYSKYERKDVEKTVQYSNANSGIKMFFTANGKLANVDGSQIAIYLDDYGTRFDFAFSGKILSE